MNRILIACEFSGIVRDAFIARGFNAISCDLLDSESSGGPHIKGNVLDIIDDNWLAVISFPPCTYLCVSGIHWNNRIPGRAQKTEEAVEFALKIWNSKAAYKALENPVGVLSTRLRKPDQIIHPWMFGHDENKQTCLWLQNLPKLKIVTPELENKHYIYKPRKNQTGSGQNKMGRSAFRAMDRSRTYPGIADAMAKQWGDYINASH